MSHSTKINPEVDLLRRVLFKEILYRACAPDTEQCLIERSKKGKNNKKGLADGNVYPPVSGVSAVALIPRAFGVILR